LRYISILEVISVSEFDVCSDFQNPLVVMILNIVAVRSQYNRIAKYE